MESKYACMCACAFRFVCMIVGRRALAFEWIEASKMKYKNAKENFQNKMILMIRQLWAPSATQHCFYSFKDHPYSNPEGVSALDAWRG